VGDFFDPPRRGSKQERLADAALEDHLLVELAHATHCAVAVREEHAVQPPIGNGSRIDDRDHAVRARAHHRAGHAVPRDARAELGELV